MKRRGSRIEMLHWLHLWNLDDLSHQKALAEGTKKDLEKLTSVEKIFAIRVKEFGTAYLLVLEERLLLPQHTRLPSPTPSFCRLMATNRWKEGSTSRSSFCYAFDINGSNSRCTVECFVRVVKGPQNEPILLRLSWTNPTGPVSE